MDLNENGTKTKQKCQKTVEKKNERRQNHGRKTINNGIRNGSSTSSIR